MSLVLVPAPAPAFRMGADGYGLCSWKLQGHLRFPGVDGTPWAFSWLSKSLVFSPFLQDPKERPSVWVGKKGQNCPKTSVRPLAVGCVAVSRTDAHHQTRPPWPFAPTAFPSGPVSWKGLGMQRGPWGWHRIAPSCFQCHEEGEDDKPKEPESMVQGLRASRAIPRPRWGWCTLTLSEVSWEAVAFPYTHLMSCGSQGFCH